MISLSSAIHREKSMKLVCFVNFPLFLVDACNFFLCLLIPAEQCFDTKASVRVKIQCFFSLTFLPRQQKKNTKVF